MLLFVNFELVSRKVLRTLCLAIDMSVVRNSLSPIEVHQAYKLSNLLKLRFPTKFYFFQSNSC